MYRRRFVSGVSGVAGALLLPAGRADLMSPAPARGGAPGTAAGMIPVEQSGTSSPAAADWFDVRAFGAAGDNRADDTSAIQSAIDAARLRGGTVYLPPGTYRLTNRLEVVDCDHLMIRGSGWGTILNASSVSATVQAHAIGHGYTRGILAIGTVERRTALDDICVEDLAILGPTTKADSQVINVGAVDNCTIRRVRIDGSVLEAIYHDPLAGFGYSSRNFRVQDCEVTHFKANALNVNSLDAHGVAFIDNYLHGGLEGILVVGHDVLVTGNYCYDCGIGIAAYADLSRDCGPIQIVGNRVTECGRTALGPSGRVVGINVVMKASREHGLLVADNTIGPIYGGQSICAIGPWTIRGNHLCGVYAPVGGAKGNYERAIWIREVGLAGPSTTILAGNVIEAPLPDTAYSAGVYIENSDNVSVHSSGNFVRAGAIRPSSPYPAYYDPRGASTLNGDVICSSFFINGTAYNRDGTLSGKPLFYGAQTIGAVASAASGLAVSMPIYSDNAAAMEAGLGSGAFYRTPAGNVMVVH